jgi:hypothetical protein
MALWNIAGSGRLEKSRNIMENLRYFRSAKMGAVQP